MQRAGCCAEPVLPLQIPRADLTLMDPTISMCAPRGMLLGQALSVAQPEKPFFAEYSLELGWISHPTCEHLFANHSTESVLWFAGEQSSESQHKLALAEPLHANELHPGNVCSAWGSCTPAILPCSLSDPWWAGRECGGPCGTGHSWAELQVLPKCHLHLQAGNTSIPPPCLAFLGNEHGLLHPQEELVCLQWGSRGEPWWLPRWGAGSGSLEQCGCAAMMSRVPGAQLSCSWGQLEVWLVLCSLVFILQAGSQCS